MTVWHTWNVWKGMLQGTGRLQIFENPLPGSAAYGTSAWTSLCCRMHQRFIFLCVAVFQVTYPNKLRSRWIPKPGVSIQLMIQNLKMCYVDPNNDRISNSPCYNVDDCGQKWKRMSIVLKSFAPIILFTTVCVEQLFNCDEIFLDGRPAQILETKTSYNYLTNELIHPLRIWFSSNTSFLGAAVAGIEIPKFLLTNMEMYIPSVCRRYQGDEHLISQWYKIEY